jgi:hypothetical protein
MKLSNNKYMEVCFTNLSQPATAGDIKADFSQITVSTRWESAILKQTVHN